MNATTAPELDRDDLARLCRALDVAAEHYFSEAMLTRDREAFTKYVEEGSAVRELRMHFASALA